MKYFNNLSISRKLAVGFGSLGMIIFLLVGIVNIQASRTATVSDRVMDLRIPTANASLEMLNGINHALAALRGWMILGNERFVEERNTAWEQEIWPAYRFMEQASQQWTNPENVERFEVIKSVLPAFETYQKEIEDIAQSTGNVPALQMLTEQAVPQSTAIFQNITQMIDIEAEQPATAERKALLGMMADVRGSTGMAVANIRAYLLGGDPQFLDGFNAQWSTNERRFSDLTQSSELFTPEQAEAHAKIVTAREEFSSLAQQMRSMRASPDWNLANHWLSTRAAPLGAQLVDVLNEMSANQATLLNDDGESLAGQLNSLAIVSWIALIVGLGLAAAMGKFMLENISGALGQVLNVVNSIADGNYEKEIKVESSDELGKLLQATSRMQHMLIEHENQQEETLKKERESAEREHAMLKEAAEKEHELAEKERAAFEDTTRIKRALDGVESNVMLADNDGVIIYINGSAEKLFREAESDIQQSIPGFNARDVLGENIMEILKDTNHRLSSNSTYRSDIKMGSRAMHVIASPVISETGERLGTFVECLDRTSEVAVEKELQSLVEDALAGDLSQRIDLADKTGFTETLANSMNQLVAMSEQILDDTIDVLGRMSRGDLTQKIEREYKGSFNRLKQDVNSTIDILTEVVGSIQQSSALVATGSEEISQGNSDLSQRTEMQASSLEETSSSMKFMTDTVQNNAKNAQKADELVQEAKHKAEEGGEVVNRAVLAMNEINGASSRIADIIGVIDDLAFQTNLLALNASVEAARAGEQGRGFAVVASEVRSLAGRSATAAKEIKELIEDSVSKVEEGSQLVDASGKTLEQIICSVQEVTSVVGSIASDSNEQAHGIEEVNKAITHMDDMTQQNAALVEQAAAASKSMGDQAAGLEQQMAFFTIRKSHMDQSAA